MQLLSRDTKHTDATPPHAMIVGTGVEQVSAAILMTQQRTSEALCTVIWVEA